MSLLRIELFAASPLTTPFVASRLTCRMGYDDSTAALLRQQAKAPIRPSCGRSRVQDPTGMSLNALGLDIPTTCRALLAFLITTEAPFLFLFLSFSAGAVVPKVPLHRYPLAPPLSSSDNVTLFLSPCDKKGATSSEWRQAVNEIRISYCSAAPLAKPALCGRPERISSDSALPTYHSTRVSEDSALATHTSH